MQTLNKKLVECKTIENVCECIVAGAQIAYQDAKGNSILHYAILQGNVLLVSDLLNLFDRKLRVDAKNEQGDTPLLLAAKHQKHALELCSLLVTKARIKNLAHSVTDSRGNRAYDYLDLNDYHNKHVLLLRLAVNRGLHDDESDEFDSDDENSNDEGSAHLDLGNQEWDE